MATFLEMQNQLADEIRPGATTLTISGGVTLAQLKTAITNAVKNYERRKFYFNQTTNTFVTVQDQEYYGSAAHADIPNIIEIFDPMKVTVSGSKIDVCKAAFSAVDSSQDGAVKSYPEYFAYFKQQIRLYPIPDAVYTVTMAYHYRLTALSADADTNVWTTDAEELIRARARWDLAMNKLRNDRMAGRAKTVEMEALDALLSETRLRLGSGPLRVDPMFRQPGPSNITLG